MTKSRKRPTDASGAAGNILAAAVVTALATVTIALLGLVERAIAKGRGQG